MIDRQDARLLLGLVLAASGLFVLADVRGLAGLAVLVGAYLAVNGAIGAK